MSQGLRCGDTLSRIEDKHLFEEVDGGRIGILEFVLQWLTFSLGKRLYESESVFAANGLDYVLGRRTEQFSDDRKLIDVIFAGEKRFSFQHLGEDAACAPDIDLNIVLLPGKHDFGGSVVSCRDVSGHLRILDSSQAEIADFEIAVLIDENVTRLEISMNDTCAVDVFQTSLKSWLDYAVFAQERMLTKIW